jgi:uncharacterized protein YecE (DUF72 family)
MATRLHIGTKELRGDIKAYAKRFDLLEVREPAAASLKQAPSPATMRKWRRAVTPAFDFAVVAGPAISKVKPSAELETELAWLLEAATTLEARVIVIPTAPDVTPSKLWRDRLAKLLERLPRDATTIVWEPSGLWEHEDAAVQAKAWGVVLSVDPTRDVVPLGPVVFARLRSVGGTRAYSTAALDRVAAAIGERRDIYVVLETAGALTEAKALRRAVRALGSKKMGGGGLLLRPRGMLRVEDE